MMGCGPSNAIAPSHERNHSGESPDQRASEGGDKPQLTTVLHSSSKNSLNNERNNSGDSPDQRASEDSDTSQLTCTGLHSSSKNSSSDARYYVGDSPYQMESEGSDCDTPQLTTGLHFSSKNSLSDARNHVGDSPDQRASEGSDGDTPQLTTGLHSSSKNSSSNASNHVGDPPELNKVLPLFADIKAITKPSKDADLPVDVLLLTVTNCEFLACYSELKNPYRCWFDSLGYVYFSDVGESQEELKVALLRCYRNGIGPGGSLMSVKNAASVLRPKAVISVGTCSGLNPAKSKLGDVVVSAKLATYASKVVTCNQEQSTSMRTYVSKRFLDVIKNCADGWQAPLENPEAQQVQVYTDAEFLSGPEQVRTEWRRDQLAETNPQAMAIESDGEGVLTVFKLPVFIST